MLVIPPIERGHTWSSLERTNPQCSGPAAPTLRTRGKCRIVWLEPNRCWQHTTTTTPRTHPRTAPECPNGSDPVNVELLIHAIVRQTTVLIAQLATAQGIRAPIAHIADQVFADLVAELARQGVSRKVSADMFGMGLRTYRRKVQQVRESSTVRGRSLWESIYSYIKQAGLTERRQVVAHFSRDDEEVVIAVLFDLCESRLLMSSGAGPRAIYRATTAEENSGP